ncbi:hypothetical protein C6497_12905 [Candidatus Poribacteria bacterium]|nr:MAG: hypothetical protein C6497_12905 [Candidatus Poribacteria bacterium]
MMKKRNIYLIPILGCIALCSIFAWAQKNSETQQGRISLAEIGVTPEQKSQIDAMWKLKLQKHRQAVEDLKTLNRYVKDTLMSEKEIKETLEKVRSKRKEMQDKIDKAEETLIKHLSPRAQLHLTVFGILDNGLPRRTTRTQTNKKVEQKNSDNSTSVEQPLSNILK